MLLWFAGCAIVIVWAVFRDPALDYRLVAAGALAPDVLDIGFGGLHVAHTLAGSVALLTLVMLATIGRRRLRRRLLAVPIGTFLHLVLDGAWTHAEVFWWPFMGWALGEQPLPALDRGWWNVPLEVAGAAALLWWGARVGLREPGRLRVFLRSGRLPRNVVA